MWRNHLVTPLHRLAENRACSATAVDRGFFDVLDSPFAQGSAAFALAGLIPLATVSGHAPRVAWPASVYALRYE